MHLGNIALKLRLEVSKQIHHLMDICLTKSNTDGLSIIPNSLAIVTTEYEPFGDNYELSIYYKLLAKELLQEGFAITILVFGKSGPPIADPTLDGNRLNIIRY
jgi:hypothetical protein